MRNSGKTTRGMRRKSYRGSNTGRRLMPNDAQRRERIRNALMLTIVLLELILVLVVGACVMLRRNSELVFESILENEKQDLKFSVDNVIKDLDRQRRDLEAEGLSDEKIKTVVQKHLYAKIHSDQFSDSQYMWVNQILNYAGGDNYAIRLIHAGMPETEGQYLSTAEKDIRGNTPYETELAGVKAHGSGFQRYYFPDPVTGKETEKVEYFCLYQEYDWVLCEGENLTSIKEYETRQQRELMPVVIRLILFGSLFLTAITVISMSVYSGQHNKILREKNRALNVAVYQDALTKIYNRGGLILHLDQWLEDKETGELTGVFLDLDDFKLINDLYGHAAGDAALCRLADYLTESFPDALVGRTGGDEFCVMIRNKSPQECEKRILKALQKKIDFSVDGRNISFTVSAGYASYPSQAAGREQLMRVMDVALYAAKAEGKHTARRFCSGMSRIRRERFGFSVNRMAAGMPGAFLVYRADQGEEILFGNDHLIRLYECRDYDDFLQYTKGSFRHMIHPEDADRAEQEIREQIQKDQVRNPDKTTGFEDYITYRIVTKTGKIKSVLDMGRLVQDEHYGAIYYVFLQDMEALRHLEVSVNAGPEPSHQ